MTTSKRSPILTSSSASHTQAAYRRTSPIFIVGAPRSGTTLLAKILGRHPEIYALAPAETNFFEDVWGRRKALGSLQRREEMLAAAQRTATLFGRFNLPDAQAVADRVIDVDTLVEQAMEWGGGYGALYYAFTSQLAAAAGKPRFCDDTPKHLYYIAEILDLFPQAKIVACVRDPRDFLNSYKNLWLRSTEGERIQQLFHPVNTSLLWRSSAAQIHRFTTQICQPQVTSVRYETLVADPAGEVERLCRFLEIDYASSLVEVDSHNSSFEADAASGIFQSSVGRWKEGLTPEEIWCAQTLSGKYLADFCYEPADIPISIPGVLHLFFTAPAALLRAVNANKEKRAPVHKYFSRRLQTLLRS